MLHAQDVGPPLRFRQSRRRTADCGCTFGPWMPSTRLVDPTTGMRGTDAPLHSMARDMAELFRKSSTWVVDYRYDGRARRTFRIVPEANDPRALMEAELADLYGGRAELAGLRLASDQEELAFLRGEEPKNAFCPTGRMPRSNQSGSEGANRAEGERGDDPTVR